MIERARHCYVALTMSVVPPTRRASRGRHSGPAPVRRGREARPRTGGAVVAAALAAVTLTSVSLAVDRPAGEPVFPELSSARPDAPPPAPFVPVVPEPTGPDVPSLPTGPAAPAAPAPAAPAAPAAPTVPVGRNVVFVADYETGDFSQWGTCQSAVVNGSCDEVGRGDRAMRIVEEAVPGGGRYAAKFSVRDGDVPDFGGGERAEVSENEAGAETREGDERWYEWWMRLPEGFREPTGDWFIVMQWHSGSGSPPLAIDLSRGTVDVGGDGTDAPRRTMGPIRPGEWVHYVLHVRFSRSAKSGFVEAWENGKQTVPRTARATMSSSENYLKQGIYRDEESADAAEVEFAGLRVTAP